MIDLLVSLSIWDGIYGFLSAMMQPLYWAVSGMVVLFHSLWSPVFGHDSGVSWALAIVCLTLVVRTLMIPLFVKQVNSARAMQLLQPKLRELQKKHGHDRNRLAQESQKLYAEEGINPLASCFPMLLQAPVLLSLFRVLQGIADNQVRGYFFQSNSELVTSLQNAELWGIGLSRRIFPLTPFGITQIAGIVLVVLMVLTLVATQLQNMGKNMPPEALTGQMAQTQKMMLYLFPVMYAFSSVVIPIGVLIYWLTSNIWTMVQQWVLIRNNPAPNTPAYIEWEERLRAAGKDPDAIYAERIAKRRKVRRPAATQAAAATDENGRRKVARQQVSRSTVREPDEGNGKITVRRQPRNTTRAARKKK